MRIKLPTDVLTALISMRLCDFGGEDSTELLKTSNKHGKLIPEKPYHGIETELAAKFHFGLYSIQILMQS